MQRIQAERKTMYPVFARAAQQALTQINGAAERDAIIMVSAFISSAMLMHRLHMPHRNFRAHALVLAALVMALLLFASRALAQSEPSALIDQQHCMFCHTNDAPFLAPSFQQIAERYRNDPDAQIKLEHKLRAGGRAHWGDMAMPGPAERGGPLSPEDAHTLVEWVLRH
jgi:cytochrome c